MGTPYPVRWVPALELASTESLAAEWTRTRADAFGDLARGALRQRPANCAQWKRLHQAGHEAAVASSDGPPDAFSGARCLTLELLQWAEPAHSSFLRDTSLAELTPADLPAVIGTAQSGEDVERRSEVQAKGGSLLALDPTTRVLEARPGELVLSESGDSSRLTLSPRAWGDFNHDGVDDLALQVQSNMTQGTAFSVQLFVLTRLTRAAPLSPVTGMSPYVVAGANAELIAPIPEQVSPMVPTPRVDVSVKKLRSGRYAFGPLELSMRPTLAPDGDAIHASKPRAAERGLEPDEPQHRVGLSGEHDPDPRPRPALRLVADLGQRSLNRYLLRFEVAASGDAPAARPLEPFPNFPDHYGCKHGPEDYAPHVAVAELSSPQLALGWIVESQERCGNTNGYRYTFVLPRGAGGVYDTLAVSSEEWPRLVVRSDGRFDIWYRTRAWGNGGTSVSTYVLHHAILERDNGADAVAANGNGTWHWRPAPLLPQALDLDYSAWEASSGPPLRWLFLGGLAAGDADSMLHALEAHYDSEPREVLDTFGLPAREELRRWAQAIRDLAPSEALLR